MHEVVENLIKIKEEIKLNFSDLKDFKTPKIIAVSKTFGMNKILPLIEYGHLDFGRIKYKRQSKNGVKLNLIIIKLNYT